MANHKQHSFHDMEVGDTREYYGECPVQGKKSTVHTAFYKYAQRNQWKVKTTCDRSLDLLLLERVA